MASTPEWTPYSIVSSIVIFILFIYLIKYNWSRRRLYYYAAKYRGPWSLPIIGSALHFMGEPHVIFAKMLTFCQQFHQDGFFRIWMGPLLFFVPTRADYVDRILKSCIHKSIIYQIFGKDLMENGLVTATADIWKPHRKVINLTFHQNILNSYLDSFIKHAKKFVDDLGEENEGEVFALVHNCTTNMICETTLDISPSQLGEQKKYINMMSRGQDLIMYRLFNVHLYPNVIWKQTKIGREFDIICNYAWGFIRRVIEMKRQHPLPKNKRFLNYLLELGGDWSDREVMEETQTMIVAGSETTAVTECFALLLLALNPEVQERLYAEVRHFDGDFSHIDYLERVLKETLRMFPTIPIVARFLPNDLHIDEHCLPAGSDVMVPIIIAHRDPKYWPEPMKFDPDRFVAAEVEKRPPYSYMPFGVGSRSCIGFKYAMMSMKCLLGNVVKNYRIFTKYRSILEVEQEFGVTSKPKQGFQLKLIKRGNV